MTQIRVANPVRKDEKGNATATGSLINKKIIDNHKQAAAHNNKSAQYHLAAAKNHEDGHHEMAAHNTVLANGHYVMAGEFLSDDAKHHAQVLKQTNFHV